MSVRGSEGDDRPPPRRPGFQAAVALVLRATPGGDILLIKRAHSERDPWSGHMAFPGGRRDPADASLQATAIRETREETGLDLAGAGVLLGRLESVSPGAVRLPRLSVTPFVYSVPAAAEAHPASPEVEAVYWVPLDLLRRPEARAQVEIPLPGGSRTFPCYRVADEIVWGLTYRILNRFLERELPAGLWLP